MSVFNSEKCRQFRSNRRTIDDAPGECFDKIATFLGMGYPGGPLVELKSKNGNENRFPFPKPLMDNTSICLFQDLKLL